MKGKIIFGYIDSAWRAFDENAVEIDTSSAGSDDAAKAQIAINYSYNSGYNLEAFGPSTNAAGAAPAIMNCKSTISFPPGSFRHYRFTGMFMDWNGFNAPCVEIDVQNGGSIILDCHMQRSTSTSTETAGIIFWPKTPEPMFGSTIHQHHYFRSQGIFGYGSNNAGYGYVFNCALPNYQIVQSRFDLGYVDGQPARVFRNAALINNPNANGGAFNDNRIKWTRFVSFAEVGLRVGTFAGGGVLAANKFSGAMENVGTSIGYIDTFGMKDTYDLTSMDINNGSVATGVHFRSNSSDNYFVCPQIVATTPVVNEGTNNNIWYRP